MIWLDNHIKSLGVKLFDRIFNVFLLFILEMTRSEDEAAIKAARKKIKDETWKCRPIQEKDIRSNTAMDVYEVFLRVYDKKNQTVPAIFVCRFCKLIMHVPMNNGNAPLKRHPCYKAHFKSDENAEKGSEEEERDEDGSSVDDNDKDDDDDPNSPYVPFISSDMELENESDRDDDKENIDDEEKVESEAGDDGEHVNATDFADVLVNFAKIYVDKGPFTVDEIKEALPNGKLNW